MTTRILSALVALAIVIPVLAFGGPMGVWWLMFPLILVGMDEYVKMALPGVSRVEWALVVAGGGGVAGDDWSVEESAGAGAGLYADGCEGVCAAGGADFAGRVVSGFGKCE